MIIYWKYTAAVWGDTTSRFIRISDFLAFLQVIMQNFIRPNERALKKMLRIHHINLFHIRGIVSIAQCGGDLKIDAKIDEYEISLSDESEAFF